MIRWIQVTGLAACLLASSELDVGLEAQSSFVANKGAKRLKVVYETDPFFTSSTSFRTFTSTTITVPSAWNTGRIVARFSGESECGGDVFGWCSVRILVNGAEMTPASGGDFAFDNPGPTIWESNSVERTSGELGPGTHTVTVQGAVINGATAFALDDSAFTIILWRVS